MATSITTSIVTLSCKHSCILLFLLLGYGFLTFVNCSRRSTITMEPDLRSSIDKAMHEDTTLLRNNVPRDENSVPLIQSDASFNAKFGAMAKQPINLAMPSHLRTNVPQGKNSYLLDDGTRSPIHLEEDGAHQPHNEDDGGQLSSVEDDNLHLMEYGDHSSHNKDMHFNLLLGDGFLRTPTHEEHSFLLEDGVNHKPNNDQHAHIVLNNGIHQSLSEEEQSSFPNDGFLRTPTHEENSKLLDDGIKSTTREEGSSLIDNGLLQSPKHKENPYFLDYGFLRSPTHEEDSNLLDDIAHRSSRRAGLGRSRSCSINALACEENAHILGLATTPRCCSGSCVDISSSPNHCGACQNPCPLHLTCCNGKCTNLNDDPNNCGKCNQRYEVCYLGLGNYYDNPS